MEDIDFIDWINHGVKMGWCSKVVCETHEGLPMNDEQEKEWEDGFDPCMAAVRIW